MARPVGGYRLKNGKRIPGVTTITGRFKESSGLIHWAWEQGIEGKDLYGTRDAAAEAGSPAHDMVENFILGKPAPKELQDATEQVRDSAQKAFGAFMEWAEQSKLQIIQTECSLISEEYEFGGTLDAIAVNDKLSLADWKTSKRVFKEYRIQLAAYKQLWEENNPDKPIEGGFHLIRFDKKFGDFSHHYYPELDKEWELFRLYRKAYELDKQLKDRN